jgi:hypothetical protein
MFEVIPPPDFTAKKVARPDGSIVLSTIKDYNSMEAIGWGFCASKE